MRAGQIKADDSTCADQESAQRFMPRRAQQGMLAARMQLTGCVLFVGRQIADVLHVNLTCGQQVLSDRQDSIWQHILSTITALDVQVATWTLC